MAYITEYGSLNPKELRQLAYKRQFKAEHPEWDDSMVLLARLVNERLPDGACVLDAGCGHGNYVIDELKDTIGRAVGIDAEPSCTSKNVCLDEIVHGTLETLPFEGESFDAVISLWVLEHLQDPARTFAEIHRVLKPGGFFAFVTPNSRAVIVTVRRMMSVPTARAVVRRLYGRKEQDTFDVRYRANTSDDIRRLSSESGFAIAHMRENPDPSYTSFGPVTYRASTLFARIRTTVSSPHIIGVLEKPMV